MVRRKNTQSNKKFLLLYFSWLSSFRWRSQDRLRWCINAWWSRGIVVRGLSTADCKLKAWRLNLVIKCNMMFRFSLNSLESSHTKLMFNWKLRFSGSWIAFSVFSVVGVALLILLETFRRLILEPSSHYFCCCCCCCCCWSHFDCCF